MWTANDVEYWEGFRFTQIVALHSELVGLSVQGHLHQWRWTDSHPYRHFEVTLKNSLISSKKLRLLYAFSFISESRNTSS